DAAESDDEDPRDTARKKQEEEDKEAVGTVEKQKNWSSVNLAFQESKLNYRGSFSALSFTNWLWYRCACCPFFTSPGKHTLSFFDPYISNPRPGNR
ncbi:abfD, partial [Symbiodinium necroappetens]